MGAEHSSAARPDADGVYPLTSDMVVPVLLHGVPAVASPDDLPDCEPPVINLSAVIDASGQAEVRDIFSSRSSPCANLAILALKKSSFQPAKLNGLSIPVLVCLTIPFRQNTPAIPNLRRCPAGATIEQADKRTREISPVHAVEGLSPSTAGRGPLDYKVPEPVPDEHGIYSPGPGITPPRLTNSVAAGPSDDLASCGPRGIIVSVVITGDGSPQIRGVYGSGKPRCENLAVQAVKQSSFQPALLRGRPVPVLVCVGVPFSSYDSPTPRFIRCPPDAGVSPLAEQDPQLRPNQEVTPPPGVKPPIPIGRPEAQYSEEARKKGIQGDVLVSVVIDENGLPAAPRVVKSLGYGLDESAVAAALKTRFHPATRDGTPVSVRITISVSFRLVD